MFFSVDSKTSNSRLLNKDHISIVRWNILRSSKKHLELVRKLLFYIEIETLLHEHLLLVRVKWILKRILEIYLECLKFSFIFIFFTHKAQVLCIFHFYSWKKIRIHFLRPFIFADGDVFLLLKIQIENWISKLMLIIYIKLIFFIYFSQ